MLKVEKLKKSFWSNTIFEDAELNLGDNINAWLVWINGVGKTTLFKILSWEDDEYEWSVVYSSKTPLIWYMKQQMSTENIECSILEFMKNYTGIGELENKIDNLITQLEYQKKMEEYTEVYDVFDRLWWYDFEYKSEKILNQLWLWKYSLNTNVKQLSWWEKRKLLLCSTLLKWWDLLLLDEPTNDLDTSSIEWLTTLLKESLTSCLIVSHDKEFLNNVTKKIFEINNNKIIQYSWNYDFYERQKKMEYEKNIEAYERQQEEELRIKKVTQELKQKAQSIGNKWNLRDNDKWDWASKVEKKLAKSAKNMQNRIDRMEQIEKPKIKKPTQIMFNPSEEILWWIDVNSVKFKYEDNDDFELNIKNINFSSKDKIIIYWENWSGKSTFLKLIKWDLNPTSWYININKSFKIWYFSQEQDNLPLGISAIDFLIEKNNYLLTDVHSVLWAMWFQDEDKKKNIELLSPGMKLRLTFALISLKKDNCLLFDEPTNHVDVDIKEALKSAINNFNWMVIVVSHDKSFINKIKFNKKIFFEWWTLSEK
jgi:ATP-binding cassette, subfamily F, member 3